MEFKEIKQKVIKLRAAIFSKRIKLRLGFNNVKLFFPHICSLLYTVDLTSVTDSILYLEPYPFTENAWFRNAINSVVELSYK